MEQTAYYKPRRPMVISDVIDDEVVIINMDNGTYFSLDQSGADVWRALDGGLSLPGVVELLQASYEGEPGSIASAVELFVAELRAENLIVPADGARPPEAAPRPAPTLRPPFTTPALHKYEDMQDIILLDPIHEVDDSGWPARPAAPESN